jgi:hypothetical protein
MRANICERAAGHPRGGLPGGLQRAAGLRRGNGADRRHRGGRARPGGQVTAEMMMTDDLVLKDVSPSNGTISSAKFRALNYFLESLPNQIRIFTTSWFSYHALKVVSSEF